jgi:hypothetical protein
VLNEYDIARGLSDSYRSTQRFSPFILQDDNDNEQVIDDSHIRYFTEHIKESFHIETSEHWEAVASLLDVLSEKVMVKAIDLITQNHEGVDVSKIERLTRDNAIVNDLIEAGIVEKNGENILPGSNLDKVVICLETLRTLVALIEKERELKRLRKVTIDPNQFNLSNADLRGANLIESNLTEAKLINADLSKTNLFGAYLSGAILINTDFTGANTNRIKQV